MTTLSSARPRKKTTANHLDSWIYVPEGFDPADYPGPIADHPDGTRWIINCIYFRRVILNFDPREYVSLHSGLLSLIVGKTELIRPLREALEAHRLIECDHEWSRGRKSLGYRLGPLLGDRTFRLYTSTNKRFRKRVEKFKRYVTSAEGLTLPAHVHLDRWARKVRLSPVMDNVAFPSDEKRTLARHQADLIDQGLISTSVCSYGRFHSNFSGLCRELRPRLSYQGNPLHEIDLANSQPYFLAMILLEHKLSGDGKSVDCLRHRVYDWMEEEVSKRAKAGGERERSGEDHMFSLFRDELKPHTPKSGTISLLLDMGIETDLREWIERAMAGTTYEAFLGQDYQDRDEIKPLVFQVLYGDSRVMDNAPLARAFRARFPTVHAMLKAIKQRKGYRWVGQELQRRESQVVIGQVCGWLAAHRPSVPVVTVHDSILTTAEHLSLVTLLIRDALARYPFQARLRRKPQEAPHATPVLQATY